MTLQSTLGRVLHLKTRASDSNNNSGNNSTNSNKDAHLATSRPSNSNSTANVNTNMVALVTYNVTKAGGGHNAAPSSGRKAGGAKGEDGNSPWVSNSASSYGGRRKSITGSGSRDSASVSGRGSNHSSNHGSLISNSSSSISSISTSSNSGSDCSSIASSVQSPKGPSDCLPSLDIPPSPTQDPNPPHELALVLLSDGSVQLFPPGTEASCVLSPQGHPTLLRHKSRLLLGPSERLQGGTLYYAGPASVTGSSSGSSSPSSSLPSSPTSAPSPAAEPSLAQSLSQCPSGSNGSMRSPPLDDEDTHSTLTLPLGAESLPPGRGSGGKGVRSRRRRSLSGRYDATGITARASFACDSGAPAKGPWFSSSRAQTGSSFPGAPAAYPAPSEGVPAALPAAAQASAAGARAGGLLSGHQKQRLLEKWQREQGSTAGQHPTRHEAAAGAATLDGNSNPNPSTSSSNPWGLADPCLSAPSTSSSSRARRARHSVALGAYEQQRLRTELLLLERCSSRADELHNLLGGASPAVQGVQEALTLTEHLGQLRTELLLLRSAHNQAQEQAQGQVQGYTQGHTQRQPLWQGQRGEGALGSPGQEPPLQWLATGAPHALGTPGTPLAQGPQASLRRSRSTRGTAGAPVEPLLTGDSMRRAQSEWEGMHRGGPPLDLSLSAQRHGPGVGATVGTAGSARKVGGAMNAIPEGSPAVAHAYSWPAARSSCKR